MCYYYEKQTCRGNSTYNYLFRVCEELGPLGVSVVEVAEDGGQHGALWNAADLSEVREVLQLTLRAIATSTSTTTLSHPRTSSRSSSCSGCGTSSRSDRCSRSSIDKFPMGFRLLPLATAAAASSSSCSALLRGAVRADEVGEQVRLQHAQQLVARYRDVNNSFNNNPKLFILDYTTEINYYARALDTVRDDAAAVRISYRLSCLCH